MKRITMTMTVLVLATSALAGPPAPGAYTSTDLGGTMLVGRFSESWADPLGTHSRPGNAIHALSWDGVSLGTQWQILCPSALSGHVLISDNRGPDGTGEVVYHTTYLGGTFWMSASGPWGDGTVDYAGTLHNFVYVTTFHYEAGGVIVVRGSATLSGAFVGFDACIEATIRDSGFVGTTESGTLPADYPAFRDASCSSGIVRGGWGVTEEISLQINGSCTLSTQETTWGAVKALYR